MMWTLVGSPVTVNVSVPFDQVEPVMLKDCWYVGSMGRFRKATAAGMSYALPSTYGPAVTSGPTGGNGCARLVAQAVGNVVQLVQTFHQLRPVPPLGWG